MSSLITPDLLRHLPDRVGVHLDEDTHEYVVTYRNQEERIHTSENPDVHMLLDMAYGLVSAEDNDETA